MYKRLGKPTHGHGWAWAPPRVIIWTYIVRCPGPCSPALGVADVDGVVVETCFGLLVTRSQASRTASLARSQLSLDLARALSQPLRRSVSTSSKRLSVYRPRDSQPYW